MSSLILKNIELWESLAAKPHISKLLRRFLLHNSNDFYYKDYKAWCEMRGVSVTSEIKRFVMEELDKYYAELDRLHEEEQKK